MLTRPWIISIAFVIAAAAAGAAHYVAMACCSTRLSIVGLLGYSLRDGYWLDWLLVSLLALSAVLALASFAAPRMKPPHRAAVARSADVLMLAGVGVAVLVPASLWAFVFVPGIDRHFDGVWAYYIIQSPLVDTFMYMAIGSLAFALAGWARLRAESPGRE